jgi:hypothetical protein
MPLIILRNVRFWLKADIELTAFDAAYAQATTRPDSVPREGAAVGEPGGGLRYIKQ